MDLRVYFLVLLFGGATFITLGGGETLMGPVSGATFTGAGGAAFTWPTTGGAALTWLLPAALLTAGGATVVVFAGVAVFAFLA